MKQLTATELELIKDLLDSMQQECKKAKQSNGWISEQLIQSKIDKINTLVTIKK